MAGVKKALSYKDSAFSVGVATWANVSKFRKTNKRPSRICGGFFVYDLSGGLHSSRT